MNTNLFLQHSENQSDTLVVIGAITNAHGIKGAVKIKSFTENPEDIFAFAPLMTDTGDILNISKIGVAKGLYMAAVSGCNNRTDAENLKGTQIYVSRTQLPALNDGEYYHTDLIGCKVLNDTLTPIGTVKALHNYGAGDLIEILFTATNDSELFLFASTIGDIDIAKKTVVFHMPNEIYADMHHVTKNHAETSC